jgi:hypothetical protein
MITLTHENFIKARDYVFANSDDINRAWFHYNFEGEDTSLGYVIRQQDADGCWHLHWRFGDGEAFDKMQALFEAHLTMLILAELNRFGRIAR